MAGCCDPKGYDAIFGERFARRAAKRYRKRGLSRTEQRIVAYLAERGVDGATVLDIGGGVGELHIELLRRGASHATNLEIASGYEREAQKLIEDAGMAGRVSRRHVDIAKAPDDVDPADIVILHRVVCCYPDYERLLSAAGSHARRLLVFSHPPRNAALRGFLWLQNLVLRLTGNTYQAFAHPPEGMVSAVSAQGLVPIYRHRGPIWHVVALQRA
jgi:magnesium-protoporphyrin O-methyltransferase